MFNRLFRRGGNRTIIDALYGKIVASARQPGFYSAWDVPDTPLGRFEMLSLHMFLVMHRLRGEDGASAALSQELADEFFKDVDHSLRELGIGDMGVPKRMKKLAKMFYGRVGTYGSALNADDRAELAVALKRNVRSDAGDWPQAPHLADYVFAAREMLARQPSQAIQEGAVGFPEPAVAGGVA